MWPEPRDLAFLIAACVAGLFSYIIALNSKDATITTIREKWLEKVKKETSEFLASINMFVLECIEVERIDRILAELRSGGSEKNGTRIDNLVKKKQEVTIRVNKHLLEINERSFSLDIEINSKNQHFKKLHRRINLCKKYVNRNKRNRSLRKNLAGVKSVVGGVRDEAKLAYKTEWDMIKKGEGEIVKQKNIALSGVAILVVSYIVYAILYYAIGHKGGEVVIKIMTHS